MMHKLHVDTDLGGDIDDLCALAMVLRWPGGVDLVGVTTVGDSQGQRAGYVRYALELEGRSEVPVAAGADVSQGYYRYELGLPPEERYWPEPVAPFPTPVEEAIQLLKTNIEQGATLVAIGPYTNLFLLDNQVPGILQQADLFLMGGYVHPPRSGFPNWGNEMDFNVQADVQSARHVLQHTHPTLVPLSVTVETSLRRAYLDDLRRAGALGRLIARQAEAFAQDEQHERQFGATCAGLPQDTINFQHDALACAIALGWETGVELAEIPLMVTEEDGWLRERIHPAGNPVRLVTAVDAARFNQHWLDIVAQR